MGANDKKEQPKSDKQKMTCPHCDNHLSEEQKSATCKYCGKELDESQFWLE